MGIAIKLEHLSKKLRVKNNIDKDKVIIHLSSCMKKDNNHYDRCSHLDYIKNILFKKGYENIIERSFLAKSVERKKDKDIYKFYA
ncbi:CGGC domain-containing protein [Clostridium sp. MSJ-4]|uniref:CGGC domain-containing protein n=1 Tax=Clostridium simiarum TaxID=2841506 RepID=A0ABS6F1A8_9CLOT|nr:CGGC domain-containing protein [Clostridium simiarum]MBU5592291.1 CGGC domain-containing protein [Clostridium simiarum]